MFAPARCAESAHAALSPAMSSSEATRLDDPSRPTSGFAQLTGYRLVDWQTDTATVEVEIGPQHMNRSDRLHGGMVTTLIDVACGYAGTYCTVPGNVRRALTLSMSCSFLGTAQAGVLRAVARKRGGGRRIFTTTCDVFGPDGELIAVGEAVYRYRSGSEDPEGVPA